MKKQRLFKLAALLVLCCAMVGCGKEQVTTTIYGTVFNATDHEPIIGAKIEVGYLSIYDPSVNDLWNINHYGFPISSSVSGSDGQFEISFGEVPANKGYYIYITRSGFNSYYVVTGVQIGSSYRMDFNLYPNRTTRTLHTTD